MAALVADVHQAPATGKARFENAGQKTWPSNRNLTKDRLDAHDHAIFAKKPPVLLFLSIADQQVASGPRMSGQHSSAKRFVLLIRCEMGPAKGNVPGCGLFFSEANNLFD